MNRAIFVSYRRDDAEGEAGRLYDDLARAFGSDSVFIDVAGIAPGLDFRQAIDSNVAVCGVFLAVMGPRWIDIAAADGTRRLDNTSDFVRLEVASALARNIPVVPVLVRGAAMPAPEHLPESIRDLAFRNAVELSHSRWSFDTDQLLRALKVYVQPPSPELPAKPHAGPEPAAPPPARIPRLGRKQLALAAAALLLLLAAYPLYRTLSRPQTYPPADPSIKPPANQSVPTTGADENVAQIQQTLNAAASTPAKSTPSPTTAPELPFRKGPPLAPGDINGTWTSQAPSPTSFANKIVISGSGRYRTLYILGSCGNQGFEFTTPDADFVHGMLTYVHSCPNWGNGQSESKVYFTIYRAANGLFMHAESRPDKGASGSHTAGDEEVGYYDNASAPNYVPARPREQPPTAPKIPFADGPPQISGNFSGTWLPLTPQTSGLAFKVILQGDNEDHNLDIWGQTDKKPFSYGGRDSSGRDIIDGKLTATFSDGDPKGKRDSKIYYTIYLTAKGLFVHAERWLDHPPPGSQQPLEKQDGLYHLASTAKSE